MTDRRRKKREAGTLAEPVEEARELAEKLGLSPYPVNYWIVDHDEMNELMAYGGFQRRYPHWRWGMAFERHSKTAQYLGGKAFEIVNNDSPAHAFLQESNSLADQKAVVTHVEAHADFFANNEWFGLFADRPPESEGAGTDAAAGTGAAAGTDAAAGANAEGDVAGADESESSGPDDGRRGPDAAAMLARHARTIEEYMADPEVDRGEVERWIDNVLCLEDNVDQHRPPEYVGDGTVTDPDEVAERLDDLGLSDEVQREVFDEEWVAAQADDDGPASLPAQPEKDLLRFLREHGRRYDEETGKAVEMEEWQTVVLDVLRRESYYFAPQKMTKVCNEGWAAYWESMMMGEETFAGADEFVDYADHQARVLGSPGLNPYKLGKELWEYVENTANRREVAERLLTVEGVTWRNFHEAVDFEAVREALRPPEAIDAITPGSLDRLDEVDPAYVDHDALERARAGEVDVDSYPWKLLTYEGLARRHYSLAKPQYRGFIERISREELERISRYRFESDRYPDVEAALADVEFTAGWEKLYQVRESHNDVTFIDEFLTQEFVDANNYFTYEYSHATGDYRATSTDYRDVKKKLLLKFTNFGKPTIAVYDANYENRNELLLGHQYNGVMLDLERAKDTLERVFELWGRPVNLKTIVKEIPDRKIEVAERRGREPEPVEKGVLIRYDGEEFEVEELSWSAVEDLAASEVDYDTKPEEWLA